MGTPLGINSKAYYRSTGTYGSPTFTEVTIISDLAVNVQWDEADASARSSRVKSTAKTMLGLEFTGRLKVVPGNAVYTAFINALMSDDVLDVLILNGAKDVNDVRGYRCDVQVFQGNEDQAMANALFLDIVMKPNDYTNPVKAVLVASGAPTYAIPGADGDTYA